MKELNTTNLAYVNSRLDYSSDFTLCVNTRYTLFVDLKTNSLNIGLKGKLTPTQILVGTAKIKDDVPIKRRQMEFGHICDAAFKEYRKLYIMCKSKAIKRFGRKFVESQEPIAELENPYYKCAPEMKMYDANVLAYAKEKMIDKSNKS